MEAPASKHAFRSAFSLDPLLRFWQEKVAPVCSNMADMYADFKRRVEQIPELQGAVTDLTVVDRHRDVIAPLMNVVFPAASWESEVMGALTPFDSRPVYLSPEFERRFLDADGTLKGRFKDDYGDADGGRILRAYHQVAEKVYGIEYDFEIPVVRIVPDPKTGLDRYYRLVPDMRFVEVRVLGERPELDEKSRAGIVEHMADPDVLRTYLPPEKFELRGFVVIRVVEVTESELLSLL